MHSTRIHTVIGLLISSLYVIGIWHRGERPTIRQIRVKLFYCIYYIFFVLSLVVGAMKAKKLSEVMFLAELSVNCVILYAKLWVLIWKQNKILSLLNRVCVFSIRNDDEHKRFDDKFRGFIRFVFLFVMSVTGAAFTVTVVLPLIVQQKALFIEIGFPLDYKNSEIAFWIALTFLSVGFFAAVFIVFLTIIIWYLLLTCSLRYGMLGSELKNMGQIRNNGDESETESQVHKLYFEDLKSSIDSYDHLSKLVAELETSFAGMFLVQFGVSCLCVCGSIYCLAFRIGDSPVERILYLMTFLYFTSDLFMITYFGNEIQLLSDRLSYNLYESDWYNQPQSTKKSVIVFGEYLKQPQVLVIGKLYPLTLETFVRILNTSYSMFNILKSFEE